MVLFATAPRPTAVESGPTAVKSTPLAKDDDKAAGGLGQFIELSAEAQTVHDHIEAKLEELRARRLTQAALEANDELRARQLTRDAHAVLLLVKRGRRTMTVVSTAMGLEVDWTWGMQRSESQ